jgi:hypothetical protein
MKIKIFLLAIVFNSIHLGFSQEIENEDIPSIKIVSVDKDFIDFIYPIISKSKDNTSKCSKHYWYLYELNDEIVLTKTPLSSILSLNILYDYRGMLATFKNEKVFINIKKGSILNKKIHNTEFYVDFNDYDANDGDIPFYECVAYKLDVDKKTLKFKLIAKRG